MNGPCHIDNMMQIRTTPMPVFLGEDVEQRGDGPICPTRFFFKGVENAASSSKTLCCFIFKEHSTAITNLIQS